jgi:hypothetical protein
MIMKTPFEGGGGPLGDRDNALSGMLILHMEDIACYSVRTLNSAV